jgi:general secretion pathway protein G
MSPSQVRERVVRQDLFSMNAMIAQYTLEKHRRPQSLNDLVVAGYIRKVPTDPVTGRVGTWVLEWSDDPIMPGIKGVRAP